MNRPARVLDRAVWPLLWLLLIPFVTLPAASAILDREITLELCAGRCQLPARAGRTQVIWGDSAAIAAGKRPDPCLQRDGLFGPEIRCTRGAALLTLAPGVLNLVPALWLLSRRRRVRLAGLGATVLGALRMIVPGALILASGAEAKAGGLIDTASFEPGAGVLLWLLSLVVAIVFLAWRSLGGEDHRRRPLVPTGQS